MAERVMPEIDRERCTVCGDCIETCPEHALTIDEESCAYCGNCEDICPLGAIQLPYSIRLADGQNHETARQGTRDDHTTDRAYR